MNVADLLSVTPSNTKTTANEGNSETTPLPSATEQAEEFTTFLTLLTAQIRNQDPLAPLDSTQFVDQLATFSGLELQATANNFLEDISTMLAQQALIDATALTDTSEATDA